jgi:hypothetical protein
MSNSQHYYLFLALHQQVAFHFDDELVNFKTFVEFFSSKSEKEHCSADSPV